MSALSVVLKITVTLIVAGGADLKASSPARTCLSETQRENLRTIRHEHPFAGPVQVRAGDWRSPGELLASWLSTTRLPIVLSDADQLRFLPHSLPGSEIVLAVADFELNDRQIDRVVAVAKTLNIKIHALWMMHPDRHPAGLERLVEGSGGLGLNLSDLLDLPSCAASTYQISQNL